MNAERFAARFGPASRPSVLDPITRPCPLGGYKGKKTELI